MRLWSTRPKPRRFAASRAACRATTMSGSPAIGNCSSTAIARPSPPLRAEQPLEERQTFLWVPRRAHPVQLQAQLDERDGHRGLNADDDGVRAQELCPERDVAQDAAQVRVDGL